MQCTQTTTHVINSLHSLRCFVKGLECYPGAQHDVEQLSGVIDDLYCKFTESFDVATTAAVERIHRLWEWAEALDGVYRQGALQYWKFGGDGWQSQN